jgi:hypothetical protein
VINPNDIQKAWGWLMSQFQRLQPAPVPSIPRSERMEGLIRIKKTRPVKGEKQPDNQQIESKPLIIPSKTKAGVKYSEFTTDETQNKLPPSEESTDQSKSTAAALLEKKKQRK